MAKVAMKPLVAINDDYKMETDGDKNVVLLHRVKVNKSHHKAKKGGPDHRWVICGYYPSVRWALQACSTHMRMQGLDHEDVEELRDYIDECQQQILDVVEAAVEAYHGES